MRTGIGYIRFPAQGTFATGGIDKYRRGRLGKRNQEERAAVRVAIKSLQLSPVMFELGARPYPPQELYRAYLGQSDIFVGT